MENCPAATFVQYFLKNLNPFISLAIVLCFPCRIVICDFVQIKFVRHFESITRNTWCKLKLLDIFCGITAGFAYRRTSDFAFKNARRVCSLLPQLSQLNPVPLHTRHHERNQWNFKVCKIIFHSVN